MSKEKNEGEKLVAELDRLKKQPLKDKLHDVWMFIKFLVSFSFAGAIGFLGTYAITRGLVNSDWLKQDAFTVSGACAVVQSLYLMWVLVVKKK